MPPKRHLRTALQVRKRIERFEAPYLNTHPNRRTLTRKNHEAFLLRLLEQATTTSAKDTLIRRLDA